VVFVELMYGAWQPFGEVVECLFLPLLYPGVVGNHSRETVQKRKRCYWVRVAHGKMDVPVLLWRIFVCLDRIEAFSKEDQTQRPIYL